MKICFPDYYLESHRIEEKQQALIRALDDCGVNVTSTVTADCAVIFCGSIFKSSLAKEFRLKYPNIPVVHYNWDIYGWRFSELTTEGALHSEGRIWHDYVFGELKAEQCVGILVPSECTNLRTQQFTGRTARIVKAAVHPFEEPVWDGGYVLDVMRKYTDPNQWAVRDACERLEIPLVQSKNSLDWDEFKKTVAGARFLISAQYECSTGGLSLEEGYWLGKPCLLSNSPWHGGIDYFGDRATYFQWDSKEDLDSKIAKMFQDPPKVDVGEARQWITREFSEEAFASRLVVHLKEFVANGLR